MKGLFIFLVVISILFFAAKLGEYIWELMKKDKYHNSIVAKYFRDYSLLGYMILLYAFSIGLYLAGDYDIAESNFTLIILAIATVLFVGEKVYFSVKNRGQICISSNFYNLNELVKTEGMEGILASIGRNNIILLNKEKFDELLPTLPEADNKKMFKKRLINECLIDGASIILSIVILVLGLVRGA